MNAAPVKRMLRWFEKDPDDGLAGEAELRGVSLEDLQREFEVDRSNPMYDCWVVEERHRSFIERHSEIKVELDRFDYFVEADAQ